MQKDDLSIHKSSTLCNGNNRLPCIDSTRDKRHGRVNRQALLLSTCLLMACPAISFAQQVLEIDVNVFGVNTNQATAIQQLSSACDAVANDTSEAALDLLNTCQLILSLDQNNPDDIGQLQDILDTFAPEEAFSVNDSIVYVSDFQTTNVYARIHSRRGSTSQETSDTASNLTVRPIGFLDPYSISYKLTTESDPLSGGGAAADAFSSNLGVFFSGQLSNGDIDGSTFEQDADITSSSFTVGADYRFNDNFFAGVGFGVLQNDTDFSNVVGGTESEGVNLTAYGSWSKENLGYIDGVLDVGNNSHDLERGIGLDPTTPVSALGSTDTTAVTFTLSAGRYFNVGSWDLGGYFRLSHTSATIDGYTEQASNTTATGSSSIFSFDSQSVTSTKAVIGVDVSRTINTSTAVLIPAIRIEFETESEEKKDELRATNVVSQVEALYRGTNRDTAYTNLGIGGSAVLKNGKSAYAYYETHLQHEFVTQNWFKIGLRLEF